MNFNTIDEILEKNKTIAYVIIAFALLPWLGSFFITTYLTGEELPAYLEKATSQLFSPELIIIYLVCSILMSLSLVINTLIIVIGAYYLQYYSLLYLSPAYMLACTIGYIIGKMLPKGPILKLMEEVPDLKAVALNMKESQVSTVGFTKMSPILPFVITNALFGILNFDFKKFFVGSFLGKWPRVLLFTFIGASIKSLRDISNKSYGKEWWVWLVGAVIFCLSLAGLYYTVIKKRRKNPEAIKLDLEEGSE
ncbi:MAG TPA: VTT domain-containing protein [Cytophagales bacterium]|nr:VTT domain-containing protein [Cytophagales bacterium]